MSSKFLKSKLLTFALAAAMLFGVIGFAGAGVANAEAEPSVLRDWIVTENAETPMVDKLVTDTSNKADAVGEKKQYATKDGKVEKTVLDSRSGLKLITKRNGVDAEGSEFRFAETQNGKFEVDFRIVSEHSNANKKVTVDDNVTNIDDIAALSNPYADVVKVTFTFTDLNSGKEVYLSLVSGVRNFSDTVNAIVTTDTMTKYRAQFQDDDSGERKDIAVEGIKNSGYGTKLYQTSFSNSYMFWSRSGNDVVRPSKIGFDPETMQLYAYCRKWWKVDEEFKAVILDLDDVADMGEWTEQFDENSFQGDYTVSFRVDRMTDNATKVEYNGEEIFYDRYATMMLYEVNGKPATAATVKNVPTAVEKAVGAFAETFANVDGAAIRLKEPSGLRFSVSADLSAYNKMVELFEEEGINYEFGTVIVPKDYIDADKDVSPHAEGILTITAKDGWNNTEDAMQYAAAIVNIKVGNYDRDFVGMGYLIYTIGGEKYTLMAKEADNFRSVYDVAKAAKADGVESEYIDEIITVVESEKTVAEE